MPVVAAIVADLTAQSDSLDDLVAELATERWSTPTPAQGWTIAHQVGHLLWTDRVSYLAITDGEGFTALFGALVMLTQPAVKTSLAWSTVAQMGFMILQCGLALFPLALLHIVAHSLYKAHAFLSCGGAVERIAATRRPGPVAVPGAKSVARAFAVALLIYAAVFAAFALTFGLDSKSPQAIALGAILIFGVAYLLAQGLAETAPRALTRRTALYAFATATAYFALQRGAEWLTHGTLPATPAPGALEWALITLALLSFGLVALAQATFPLWAHHPAAEGLRVHLSNGLYANALTDRLIGGFSRKFQNGAKS